MAAVGRCNNTNILHGLNMSNTSSSNTNNIHVSTNTNGNNRPANPEAAQARPHSAAHADGG